MSLCSRIIKKVHNFFHPQLGQILMLHRLVMNRSRLAANRQIEVTPAFLEQKILEYKDKGYDFVSIDEVLSRLNQPRVRQFINTYIHKKRFVCITLDDGYRDNYEIAYPIFKKHNVPFCINITTDLYERKALLWWYMLEAIGISDVDFVRYRDLIFEMPQCKIESAFEEWFPMFHCDWHALVDAMAMTKEQIVELSKDPLCTIGSHTKTHPNLRIMGFNEQYAEINEAKEKLEAITGCEVNHFAYPFGGYNECTEKVLQECNIHSSVRTCGGLVRVGCNDYRLPRIELGEI